MNLLASLLTPLLRFAARKNLPKRRGTVHLPGLGKDVRVRWDSFAIPYISAHSEADLFFAQGYLHAQDRLWQMDLNRRVFSGRLAEIFGDRATPRGDFTRHLRSGNLTGVDHFMRVIGLRHTAALSLPLLSERSAQAVDAYCGGVNAYVDTHQRRLPVEFRVLRYEPAPWQPVDCLTLAKGFALFLSSALMTRLTFLALHARLENDPEKLRSLAPRYPSWGATVTRAVSDQGAELLRFINGSFADAPWHPRGQGSNGWAVDARHSAENHALLCNDLHLRMTLPGIWYLNHLRTVAGSDGTEALDVGGASLPGSPFVYVGHNRDMAWGFVAALCDDGDLYRERIHPEQPSLYRTPDGWAEFDSRPETIAVRGRRPVERWSGTPGTGRCCRTSLRRHPTIPIPEPGSPVVPVGRAHTRKRAGAAGRSQPDAGLERLPLKPGTSRRPVAELLLWRHPRATSAMPWPEASRYGGGRNPRGCPWRAGTPTTTGPAPSPSTSFRGCTTLPKGSWPPPTTASPTRTTPTTCPTCSSPPTASSASARALLDGRFDMEYMARPAARHPVGSGRASVEALRPELRDIGREEPALQPSVELLEEWDGDCNAQSAAAALFHVFYHRLMWNIWGQRSSARNCSQATRRS